MSRLSQTTTISTVTAIVLLILAPSRFVAHAVDHAIRSQPGSADKDSHPELRASFQVQFENSAAHIRSVFWSSLLVVAAGVATALLTGFALSRAEIPKPPFLSGALQIIGIGVLLWGTLGRSDWAIQTVDGDTLPERAELALHRSLYVVGSIALVLPLAW